MVSHAVLRLILGLLFVQLVLGAEVITVHDRIRQSRLNGELPYSSTTSRARGVLSRDGDVLPRGGKSSHHGGLPVVQESAGKDDSAVVLIEVGGHGRSVAKTGEPITTILLLVFAISLIVAVVKLPFTIYKNVHQVREAVKEAKKNDYKVVCQLRRARLVMDGYLNGIAKTDEVKKGGSDATVKAFCEQTIRQPLGSNALSQQQQLEVDKCVAKLDDFKVANEQCAKWQPTDDVTALEHTPCSAALEYCEKYIEAVGKEDKKGLTLAKKEAERKYGKAALIKLVTSGVDADNEPVEFENNDEFTREIRELGQDGGEGVEAVLEGTVKLLAEAKFASIEESVAALEAGSEPEAETGHSEHTNNLAVANHDIPGAKGVEAKFTSAITSHLAITIMMWASLALSFVTFVAEKAFKWYAEKKAAKVKGDTLNLVCPELVSHGQYLVDQIDYVSNLRKTVANEEAKFLEHGHHASSRLVVLFVRDFFRTYSLKAISETPFAAFAEENKLDSDAVGKSENAMKEIEGFCRLRAKLAAGDYSGTAEQKEHICVFAVRFAVPLLAPSVRSDVMSFLQASQKDGEGRMLRVLLLMKYRLTAHQMVQQHNELITFANNDLNCDRLKYGAALERQHFVTFQFYNNKDDEISSLIDAVLQTDSEAMVSTFNDKQEARIQEQEKKIRDLESSIRQLQEVPQVKEFFKQQSDALEQAQQQEKAERDKAEREKAAEEQARLDTIELEHIIELEKQRERSRSEQLPHLIHELVDAQEHFPLDEANVANVRAKSDGGKNEQQEDAVEPEEEKDDPNGVQVPVQVPVNVLAPSYVKEETYISEMKNANGNTFCLVLQDFKLYQLKNTYCNTQTNLERSLKKNFSEEPKLELFAHVGKTPANVLSLDKFTPDAGNQQPVFEARPVWRQGGFRVDVRNFFTGRQLRETRFTIDSNVENSQQYGFGVVGQFNCKKDLGLIRLPAALVVQGNGIDAIGEECTSRWVEILNDAFRQAEAMRQEPDKTAFEMKERDIAKHRATIASKVRQFEDAFVQRRGDVATYVKEHALTGSVFDISACAVAMYFSYFSKEKSSLNVDYVSVDANAISKEVTHSKIKLFFKKKTELQAMFDKYEQVRDKKVLGKLIIAEDFNDFVETYGKVKRFLLDESLKSILRTKVLNFISRESAKKVERGKETEHVNEFQGAFMPLAHACVALYSRHALWTPEYAMPESEGKASLELMEEKEEWFAAEGPLSYITLAFKGFQMGDLIA